MNITLQWTKLPSVTRPGKSFYRVAIPNGLTWTVTQSWITGKWGASNNHNLILSNRDFDTAKQARRAVETYYRAEVL